MMTPIEILKGAREHLSDPANWYQGDYRQPGNPDCVCLLGALNRGEGGMTAHTKARGFLYTELQGRGAPCSIPSFNDDPNRTHGEILELLDSAIASAEGAAA